MLDDHNFIDYVKEHGGWWAAMGRYGAFRFNDAMMDLNCPYDTTIGPVDGDWMLRSLLYGVGGGGISSPIIFTYGKAAWNLMNWANGTGYGIGDEFNEPSYMNAPRAAHAIVDGGVPVETLFAPALAKCDKQCKAKK